MVSWEHGVLVARASTNFKIILHIACSFLSLLPVEEEEWWELMQGGSQEVTEGRKATS